MKNNIQLLSVSIVILSVFGCKLDNYDYPSAQLSGRIIDVDTEELVEQDILNGSTIQLTEHGYDPVSIQYLVIQNDGTYQNKMLFPNRYTLTSTNGNYRAPDPVEIDISGSTVHDVLVLPYIRIKNASVERISDKVVATFTLESTVEANVVRASLFSHLEPNVGEPLSQATATTTLNRQVGEDEQFSLELDVSNTNNFKPGNTYYFRIGALINVGGAKMNYAPAVAIQL